MAKELENHPKTAIQQGWGTSKSGVALRTLGVASKVGEECMALKIGEKSACLASHHSARPCKVCPAQDFMSFKIQSFATLGSILTFTLLLHFVFPSGQGRKQGYGR